MARKRTPPPLSSIAAFLVGDIRKESPEFSAGYEAGYAAAKTAHGSPGGRKGGKSTSDAKRKAARENGRKGGAAKKKSGTSPNEYGPHAHGPKNS